MSRLFFCLVVVCQSLTAQTLQFRTSTTRDGLPTNQINAIFQDGRGFLWIGTNNGLSMFDGVRFRNYGTRDGLSNPWITSICESRHHPGRLWIGTIAGGVNTFDDGKFVPVPLGATNEDNRVTALAEDTSGTIWGASAAGVFRIRSGRLERVLSPPGTGPPLFDLADGMVVVSRSDTIAWYSTGGTLQRSVRIPLAQGTKILDLSAGRGGKVFVSAGDSTLFLLRDGVVAARRKMSVGALLDVRESPDGRIWGRTETHLARLSPRDLLPELVAPVPAQLNCMEMDREGNIWLGTWFQGLLFCGRPQSVRFPDETFAGIVADSNGHLWSGRLKEWNGTLREFARDASGMWVVSTHRPSGTRPGSLVCPRYVDRMGRLWIWYSSPPTGELRCYEVSGSRGRPSTLRHCWSVPAHSVIAMYADSKGSGWVGGADGLHRIDLRSGRVVRSYGAADGLTARPDRLFEDHAGRLWVGGFDGGVFCRDESSDRFVKPDLDGLLAGDGVRALYEDQDHRVWVGSRFHGVFILEPGGGIRRVGTAEGLASDAIWKIIPEDTTTMYVATDVGFERVDRTSLRVLPQKSHLLVGRVDELAMVTRGLPWFATPVGGLFLNDTGGSWDAPHPPPVYLSGLLVNGRNRPPAEGESFVHSENTLTFEFVGLAFGDEAGLLFRTRMLGIDTAWGAMTPLRTVTYAALRPGEYTFQVEAVNSRNVVSTVPASYHFRIRPPFWSAWWFLVLVLSALLTLLTLAYRYRVHHLLAVERLRGRIAGDLHDDVGTTLGGIALFTESLGATLHSAPKEAVELNRRIARMAAEAQESLSDIIWSTAPQHDTVEEFFWKMQDLGSDLCTAHGMRYTFDLAAGHPGTRLPGLVRKNTYLIFKEALHNAVRHSRGSSVMMRAHLDHGEFVMEVRDNGIGLQNRDGPGGHGLLNMQARARAVGADLTVTSPPEGGTVVRFSRRMTS